MGVVINEKNIWEVSELPITGARDWFNELSTVMSTREATIAENILKEINYQLFNLSTPIWQLKY